MVALGAIVCEVFRYELLETPLRLPARRVACGAFEHTRDIRRCRGLRAQERLLAERHSVARARYLRGMMRVPALPSTAQ